MILGEAGKAGCLASLRPVLAALFCWQTSAYEVYSPSHAQSGYYIT